MPGAEGEGRVEDARWQDPPGRPPSVLMAAMLIVGDLRGYNTENPRRAETGKEGHGPANLAHASVGQLEVPVGTPGESVKLARREQGLVAPWRHLSRAHAQSTQWACRKCEGRAEEGRSCEPRAFLGLRVSPRRELGLMREVGRYFKQLEDCTARVIQKPPRWGSGQRRRRWMLGEGDSTAPGSRLGDVDGPSIRVELPGPRSSAGC
ncbi:uncharacterized protein LOC107179716 [Panthera tigris]|uniref:uncharacterized protein LOC107179716 n=1 Tax=Panthera tigris TaxID=9694 RepID=UPI001C6FAD3C|nr:uncharacterized protein LOC107179716 [Panthera tigris]